jgi:Cu/Ag efflux pump CusA
MLNKMIHWALASRALIIGTALILMVMGLKTATELPVEVLPDLTKPTVIILTESPGLAPEEVEMRVTQPIESALMGVAGLTRLRSNSDVALSLVYAEFGWDMDIYKARMLVQERLQGRARAVARGRAALHDTGGIPHGRDFARRRALHDQGRRGGLSAAA